MPVLPNLAVPSQGKAGNLCWACVGFGIASYYDRLSNQLPRWSEVCNYVVDVFSAHDGTSPSELRCCEDDRLTGPDCNQPFWLPDALVVTKNQGTFLSRPLDFKEVKAQIDLQRPIGVEVETSVGNHVIVIFGYDDTDGPKVLVADPAPDVAGNALLMYDELMNDYRHSGGRWTQSYLSIPIQT
jgi:papain like cysteine protease AvrRpt2